MNLKPQSLNNEGFTLIELILTIALSSLLIITIYSILEFNIKINERNFLEDDMLLNGRYALEYIKEEIATCDRIVVSSKFKNLDEKFPGNIGFVIVNIINYNELIVKDEESGGRAETMYTEKECSYTSYYFNNDNLIRINAKDLSDKLPSASAFKGYNLVGKFILDKSSIILEDDNLISISLYLGKDDKEIAKFNSTISLRAQVVR